jgi:hypothetical protein
MREKRYTYEHQIKDAQQIVEILSKEIEIQTKKLKAIDITLQKNENDLQIFMVLLLLYISFISNNPNLTSIIYLF